MDAMKPREYCIAANLRRCCWYGIFGAAGLAVVAAFVAWHVQQRGVLGVCQCCTVFGAIGLAAASPLRWRLRVDRDGIARRRLLGWDLWWWSDLANGRVRKTDGWKLLDVDRPWGRRTLDLDLLELDDRREVMAKINEHYRLPPPSEAPDTMTLTYERRHSIKLSPDGIQLDLRDGRRAYRWDEVRHLDIRRTDPLRRDFDELVLVFADREIDFAITRVHGHRIPNWRGATAEEVNEFLLRHVPPHRVNESFAGDEATTRRQVDRYLRPSQKSYRQIKWILVVAVLLLAGTAIWALRVNGLFGAAMIAGLFGLHPGLTIAYLFVYWRRRTRRLTELWGSLPDEDRRPAAAVA